MANNWTHDPRFNHFWKNYRQGHSWYSKHQISYWRSKAVAMNYENSFLYWLMQNPYQFESPNNDSCQIESTTLVEIRKDPILHQNQEIEMEITDEMLEFFAHSMRHKKERNERDVTEEVTYINVDEIPVEPVASDFHNTESSRNTNKDHLDYHQLYGTNAPRIQAMETAIQLNFNRNCDRKQPKLWPNMPLRL